MRSGGKNERGGYHAVPPPSSFCQSSPVSKPRPRSATAATAVDLSPVAAPSSANWEAEKKSRRKSSRRSKQNSTHDNGFAGTSGDEVSWTEASQSSPSPYLQRNGGSPVNGYCQRGNSVNEHSYDGGAAKYAYQNGKRNSYSDVELQQSPEKVSPFRSLNQQVSPGRFTSPVPVTSTRFYSDANIHLTRDTIVPQIFPEHWPVSKVNEALEMGRVFSCSVRVNAHNRNEAYATIEGISVDVLIDGSCAQNRAFEGDVVALLLDPPSLWPKQKNSNSNRNGSLVAQSHGFSSGVNGQGSTKACESPSAGENSPIIGNGISSQQGEVAKRSDDSSIVMGVEKVQALVKASPSRRPTGKVVAILKKSPRRDAIVGFLSSKALLPKRGAEKSPTKSVCGFGDAAAALTLSPVDTKYPKMKVLPSSLPETIAQRMESGDTKLGNEILAAYLDHWDTDSSFPHAVVTHSLGQAGELEAQRAAILFEHAVHSAEFPPEALACLPRVPWQIPEEEFVKRRDLRSTRIFSIDPPTARDLDDALSVEHLDDGLIRVGVHIADVSYFVQPGSDLDKEAQNRSTSVYMIQQVLPMLPRLLCEELCSLNPGVDRLAFSVFWDMNSAGDVVRQWIGRTVISSCCKLSYGDAQDMMDGVFSQRLKSGEDVLPKLSRGVTWDEIVADMQTLHSIAKKRRNDRFENGALRLDTGKLVFALDGDGFPVESSLYENKESGMVVEEFMLLANMTVAKVISRTFPDCALLRRHPEPNSRKLKEFEDFCKKNGFTLKTDSAAALHSSLEVLRKDLEDNPVLLSIVILYATKPMQVAKYFCTGQDRDGDWGHYALATPVYTHFTSPIRRYPDVVVHRTLAAALEAEEVLQKNLTGPASVQQELVSTKDYEVLQSAAMKHKVPEASELAMVASHCNERKMASKYVQEATDRLYLWTMLRNNQGLLSDACVVAMGPKFMSVYVSKIAMERRVYYDEVDGLKVDWLENTGTLVLDYNRPKHARKFKSRSISDVFSLPPLESEGEESDSTSIQPEALPLTLRLFSHLPVLLHASGGDTSPLEIGVRLFVTSYLLLSSAL